MPTTPAGPAPAIETHVRRAVWIAWTLVLLGAAVSYALKASDSRSAFVRWQKQIPEIANGVDIWNRYFFPNPPILPLTLYPLMMLPPVVGAMAWYVIKVGLATWVALMLLKMARGRGAPLPSWAVGLVLLLSLRPILSDLQHGNINILILFLIVASLALWRKGRDLSAGAVLGLAIAYKVTPALFLPYFAYKRSWKACSATLVSLVLYLLVVPSVIMGPAYNWQGLMSWRHHIISPFVEGDKIQSVQEVNQSMPGVLSRLLTQPKTDKAWNAAKDLEAKGRSPGPGTEHHGNGVVVHDLNLASWDPQKVTLLAKALAVGLVGLLALFCRTRSTRRDDPRLLGEFALVVLTMLFVSERSWKHHYVTLILPYTYLVYQMVRGPLGKAGRRVLAGVLAVSALLIATTSSEIGGQFFGNEGHEYALYFGMFLWSGLVLYAATAWRVSALGGSQAAPDDAVPDLGPIPAPHVGAQITGRVAAR